MDGARAPKREVTSSVSFWPLPDLPAVLHHPFRVCPAPHPPCKRLENAWCLHLAQLAWGALIQPRKYLGSNKKGYGCSNPDTTSL